MDADLDEETPVNPFSFWKGRVQDHEGKRGNPSSSPRQSRRVHPAPGNTSDSQQQTQVHTQQQLLSKELKARQQTADLSSSSGRRPPPPRPPPAEKLSPSKAPNVSSTSSTLKTLSPHKSRDVQERISKFESTSPDKNSDADSYVPSLKKSPMKIVPPATGQRHQSVKKTTSNPVLPSGGPHVVLRRTHRTSCSGLESEGTRLDKKFIPTIQTIRASNGDLLSSLDDLELYKPRKVRPRPISQEVGTGGVGRSSVLDAARKIEDSVFLSPLEAGRAGRAGGRRGSGGEVSAVTDTMKTSASSPGTSRRQSSSSTDTSSTSSSSLAAGKQRNWRSLSASRSRPPSASSFGSVKIKSSGFTSYLDGPEEPVVPPTPPPPSPLLEMSNFLKTNNVPEGNHLQPCSSSTQEVTEFWQMVQRLRTQYPPGNSISLLSPIISHQLQQQQQQQQHSPLRSSSSSSARDSYRRHDSVLVVSRDKNKEEVMVRVREEGAEKAPAEFVFSVKTTVATVLSKSLEQLYMGCSATRDPQQCSLKVCGRDETLGHGRVLGDFEYVHQCRKFATAMELVVVERKKPTPLQARRSSLPDLTEPYPGNSFLDRCVSMKEGNALLDSYHAKEEKFRNFLQMKDAPNYPLSLLTTMVQSVVSCVKLLCERLSFIEPPEITDAIFNLRRACRSASQPELETSSLFTAEESANMPLSDSDNWVTVPEREFSISEDNIEDIICALDVLREAVHHLMSLYCTSFHPGYSPVWDHTPRERADLSSFPEQLLRVRILALHRPREAELRKFDMLQMECCVFHGGRAQSKKAYSPHAKLVRNFFPTVVWNKWLNMALPLPSLCKESRILFILHGLEFPGSGIKWSRTPVAWGILRLFDSNMCLLKGPHLLGLWLGEDADPLESPYCSVHNRNNMVLQIELENHSTDIYFDTPSVEKSKSKLPGPPPNVSKMLTGIAQKDRFYMLTTSDQKIIWANRLASVSLLGSYPRGLPTVLQSAQTSNSPIGEVWRIIDMWNCADPIFGLDLLDAQFADMKVREKAMEWLSNLANDDVCDFLPQLVQSLRYDSYLASPMSEFLLKRSTQSHRIAHAVFWHLKLGMVTDVKFRDRYASILEALKKLCGEQLQQEFANQVELVEQLCAVANAVKVSRDAHRQTTLVEELNRVAEKFIAQFRLPLNPSLLVKGMDIESCSFFNSNTVPLKLSFLNADPFGDNISIIFKVGDDLRQDIVVLQMIRLMEKFWLRAGLDLKMVTYQCVATGADQGMLEMVTEAATLRAIQTEHGVTGSFKDKPLSVWLQRHNPTDHAYKQAVDNFTLSCAGYCVATYVLGICDRHNDNIMVKKSGHMFHIDFGKILGNAQMFGNIKRDRAPFVLTKDMAYVINDGDKPTVRFQKFCDLCCTAYNELRKHSTVFISLLSLILSSGLPEISSLEDVQYVRDALLPGKSEAEATYAFTKHIEDSLSSLATTINFFIHNLAQFKFSSPSNAPYSLLSFCPQAYSIATDGKIESAIITTYHKWFYPETYYVYQIEVQRGAPEKEKIFRRYREFDEMHRKLEQCFPDVALPPLPGKIFVPGKSHTKQTTERRMIELNMYMASILSLPTAVSESDIIYTFLHCLIRDEQDMVKLSEDEVRSSEYGAGKVKLELHYQKKQGKLNIVVRHVKDLLPREGLDTADPYVKLYLLPDPNKSTKQKTKISRKTLNPTYNEMFSYNVPASALSNRALQLSCWDASNMLGNHCICMTTIELSKLLTQLNSGNEFVEWFDLYCLPDF